MSPQTSRRLAIVFSLAVPVLLCGGGLADVIGSFPAPQGPRVTHDGIVGIGGDAYAWVVPVEGGVVWIDAGMDPEAPGLLEATAGRQIKAVLITHGHSDHTMGLAAVPGVPMYCGPTEASLVQGERLAGGLAASLFGRLMGNAGRQARLEEVTDGQVIRVGDDAFEAVHVPGHTTGSVVWIHEGVAFTGDSLLGHGDHLAPAHRLFATDHAQNLNSVKVLRGRGIHTVADGHAGIHTDVSAQVDAL